VLVVGGVRELRSLQPPPGTRDQTRSSEIFRRLTPEYTGGFFVVEPFASRSEMANGNKTGFPAPERKRPRQWRGLLSGGAGNRTRVLR
jgi:hypothetical protein